MCRPRSHFLPCQGSQQISPLFSQLEFEGAKTSQSVGMLALSLWRSTRACPIALPRAWKAGCPLPIVCNWTVQPQSPCFPRKRQHPSSRALATHPGKCAAAPGPGRPAGSTSCLCRLVESLATAQAGCWTSEHALGAGGEQRRRCR